MGLRIINPALSCLWSNCLTIVGCFPIAFLASLLNLRILRLKCWSYIFGRFFLLLFTPWTHLIDNLGKLAADNWLWGTWIINLMDLRHESISFWFLLELDLIWVQLFFFLCMLEKPVLVKLLVLVNFLNRISLWVIIFLWLVYLWNKVEFRSILFLFFLSNQLFLLLLILLSSLK